MTKDSYHARKAMGRCVICGKEKADKWYTTCLVCRMDKREYEKEHSRYTEDKYRHEQWLKRRRDIMYAFGVCVTCGKRDAEKGKHTCGICRVKARERQKKKMRENDSIIPREIMLDGKHCAHCGSDELVAGKNLCKKHYEIAKKNMLHARSCREEEPNLFELRIRDQFEESFAYRKKRKIPKEYHWN